MLRNQATKNAENNLRGLAKAADLSTKETAELARQMGYSTKEAQRMADKINGTTMAVQKQATILETAKKHWVALTAVIGYMAYRAAVSTIRDTTSAYIAQEDAINKMAVAMKNQGTYSERAMKNMEEFSNEIQRTTTTGDEAALSLMANLKSYGMADEVIKRATKAALDMAAAKKAEGVSVVTAGELIGKAYAGNTATLSRYGIVIKEGLSGTEKFNAVMKQLEQRFGGAAQAELDTYSGKWKNLSNQWGDFQEQIGEIILALSTNLMPTMQGVIGILQETATYWAKAFGIGVSDTALVTKHLKAQKAEIENAIKSIETMGKWWGRSGEQGGEALEKLQKQLELINKTLDKMREKPPLGLMADPKDLTPSINVFTKEQQKSYETLNGRIKQLTLSELDYKKWALSEEMRELRESSGGKEKLLDAIASYHKLKLDEMARDEQLYYTNIEIMAQESLAKRTKLEEMLENRERPELAAMRQTRLETTTPIVWGSREEMMSQMFGYHDQWLEVKKLTQDTEEKILADTKVWDEEMKTAVTGWASQFSGTLNDILWDADASFGDIAKSFGKMITQMIIQLSVIEPILKSVFSNTSSGTGNFFSSLFGSFGSGGGGFTGAEMNSMSWLAKGGIFNKGLIPFAGGGVVTRPTVFPFAGGTGLMGEAGPEAVMPLARTNTGDLGVAVVSNKTQEVKVEIINESGQKMQVRNSTAKLNMQEMIVTIWLDAFERNAYGMRDALV